jgi:diguanylate cyclase (GGDEF)-like protein
MGSAVDPLLEVSVAVAVIRLLAKPTGFLEKDVILMQGRTGAPPQLQSGGTLATVLEMPVSARVSLRPRHNPRPDEPPLLRLLIIDDDEVAREAVRRALEESGLVFELTEASGAFDGNRELHEGDYDCILLDYRFPQGDAFDLFADVLSRPCDCRPPIIMLTGMGDERIAAGAIKRGAQDYLSKVDLSSAGLRHTVEAAMETARRQSRLKTQNDLLHRMSLYDGLTDLPNRNLFLSRLRQKMKECERRNESFAVLMMDLNGFKEINDTHGHAAGDQVLRQVARRLTEATRESDTVARYGGDEYAGILAMGEHGEDVAAVAAKLCRAIDEPMMVLGKSLHVGLSMGIAMFPRDGIDSDELLRLADLAMYFAKGRCTGFAIHGALSETAQHAEPQLFVDPAQYPDLYQFEVYYEPLVGLASMGVAGVEAHVRWKHPQLGLLLPEKFVGAAQMSAMVRGLTLHIVRCAAIQIRQWRDAGIDMPLSVNLSPSLLTDFSLPEAILKCVTAHGLPPARLTIEVTENSVIDAPASTPAILNALASAGARIAIDDFGSGFALSRCEFKFPVAEFKIDRAFVCDIDSNPGHASLVRRMVEYGEQLGARVVAEGVDTEATRVALCELGCEFGEGLLFSAPASATNYRHWHRRWLVKALVGTRAMQKIGREPYTH